MNLDLVVENDTLKEENHNDWTQIIDETMLEQMKKTEGVKDVHPLKSTEIMFPWESEVIDKWMEKIL